MRKKLLGIFLFATIVSSIVFADSSSSSHLGSKLSSKRSGSSESCALDTMASTLQALETEGLPKGVITFNGSSVTKALNKLKTATCGQESISIVTSKNITVVTKGSTYLFSCWLKSGNVVCGILSSNYQLQ